MRHSLSGACAQGLQYLDPAVCHSVTQRGKGSLADYQALSSSSSCYIKQHFSAEKLCGYACTAAQE